MQKVSRLILFVPFYRFFSMTMFMQFHCNTIGNEPSMSLLTTLKVFRHDVVCVPLYMSD